MTHSRSAVRAAVIGALEGYAPLVAIVGNNVFACRITPPRGGELPCVNVHTPQDAVDPDSRVGSPRRVTHTLTVIIECIGSGVLADLPDALDALCEQVEAALGADETLGGAASDCWLSNTATEYQEDGSRLFGAATMEWSVVYDEYTEPTTNGLDDFDAANIRYSLSGEQAEADQAEDDLTDIHEA